MGLLPSRNAEHAQDTESSSANAYRYPPKTGNYFGGHFIMGGDRFESSKPDAYLFGENEDLNFLGGKPTPFPYPSTQPNEPTRTLKSLVNIRRDSLKLIKESENDGSDGNGNNYNIEFIFDTDVKCSITIYYFATEEIVSKQAIYKPRDPTMNSETFFYKRGPNQLFSQPTHFIDPSTLDESQWQYNAEKEIMPVVIQCIVEDEEHIGHSHATFAVIDKLADGSYNIRALKQKQMIDGLCYLLQEIYGIENKNTENLKADEEVDDNGSECVICMCELRDTIILPCRHLCLCNGCADNLRYQANNCPICRSKFKALLQIRAIKKKAPNTSTRNQNISLENMASNQEGIPAGYVAVSLIEALNGPTLPHRACHVPTFTSDATLQSLFNRTPDSEVQLATQELSASSPEEHSPINLSKLTGIDYSPTEGGVTLSEEMRQPVSSSSGTYNSSKEDLADEDSKHSNIVNGEAEDTKIQSTKVSDVSLDIILNDQIFGLAVDTQNDCCNNSSDIQDDNYYDNQDTSIDNHENSYDNHDDSTPN